MRSHRKEFDYSDSNTVMQSMMSLMVVLIPVLLISAEFAKTSIIDITTSEVGSTTERTETSRPKKDARLKLSLILTDSTVTVATAQSFLPTMACPPQDSLMAVLSSIRRKSGEYEDSTSIIIASENAVSFDRIVMMMDIVRENGFPDIAMAKLR